MGRPHKVGLDYFPLDTVPNWQWKALDAIHGNDGVCWYIRFLQEAYRTDDGIVVIKGIFGELMAKNNHITPQKQDEIIAFCLKPEIALLVSLGDGRYTSNGVMRRMSSVSRDRKSAISRAHKASQLRVEKSRVEESRVKETPTSADVLRRTTTENTKQPRNTSKDDSSDKKRVAQYLMGATDEWRSAWVGFIGMRKTIRHPATPRAQVLTIGELTKLAPNDYHKQAMILDQSTQRSWQGVFELKEQQQSQLSAPYHQPFKD